MDTTCIGAAPTLAQDRVQAATLPSPTSVSQQVDTSSFGAATLSLDSTHRFLCSSLSPRTRITELADIAAQLQALTSPMQPTMTTVGQLGGQMRSKQAEVTEMKNADNKDDKGFEEHDGFLSEIALRDGVMVETGEPKLESARHAPY